jgi:hypothetical protein
MPFYRLAMAGALLCATSYADVTLRYKTEVKMNPALPPQMTEQATKSMASAMPAEIVFQWKEGKGATSVGRYRTIVDVVKGQMTLIDPEKKRITTVTPDRFMEQMTKGLAEMPAEARAAMAAIKVSTDSKITGRTETIQGVASEEREVTMSIEGPPVPNMPPGPMMKMTIQFWTAKQEEIMRIPALRELTGYNIWAFSTMNPASSMEKIFQQMPGSADGIGKFMKEMQSAKAVVMRTRMIMRMPALAAVVKQMGGGEVDPESPFMEMTQEISELSSAPVPASVLALPEGYKEVPPEELVSEMMPKRPAAAK